MAIQLTINLPDDAFSVLRIDPTDFVKEMQLAAIVKWYEMGKLSQSKAAELTGLSRQDFLSALHRYNVSPFQTKPEELMEELADVS